MPGFLSRFVGTVLVDAMTGKVVEEGAERPEFWVQMLKSLTVADDDVVTAKMAEEMSIAQSGKKEPQMSIRGAGLIAQGRETLLRSLVDWNLTDDDGEGLPLGKPHPDMPAQARAQQFEITKKSLALLPSFLVTALTDIVVTANQPRGEEAEATFPNGDQTVRAGGNGAVGEGEHPGELPTRELVLGASRSDT